MAANGYRAYQAVQIHSSDPRTLVVLLFEHAVQSVRQAQEAIKQRNWERKHQQISRARQILDYLAASLDDTHAPELVSNLRALYAHLCRTLTEADLEDSLDKLTYAEEILAKLHQAWREAAEKCSQ